MNPTPLTSTWHHRPAEPTLACSRCERTMHDGDPERDEALVVSFRGGFWSVFGDENHVEGVFCQHCLQTVLGPWLRIAEGARDDGWRAGPGRRARQPGQIG